MIRKKLAGILAAIMVATTVFGSQGIDVKASTLSNVDGVSMASIGTGGNKEEVTPEVPEVLEDGTYEITNDVFKTDTTTNSGVRGYIAETSKVTVEDGKITLTMEYTDKEIILSTDYVTVNGENVAFNENENGSISFEIESIDILDTTIVIGITYANPYFGPHAVKFDFLHKGDLVKIEESDVDNSIQTPDNPESSQTPENPGSSEILLDGTYEIANDVFKTGTATNSGVRGYIAENSMVTVKNGKITLTMKYTDKEIILSTDYVTVNGENVAFNENEDGSISFEIESRDILDTTIVVGITYNNPVFGPHSVKFDFLHKGDLVKVEDSGIAKPETPEKPESSEENNSGSTGSVTTGETESVKIYIGKNEIISSSEAGKTMGRKALSEDIKIEKIGDKYRATITFTDFGSEQMSDIIVYVNGKEVETKNVRTTLNSLSFELESLDDSIEISAKIVDMGGMRVSFGLKVLQDTLLEVDNDEEGTTGGTTGGSTEGTTGGTTSGSTTTEDTTTTEETKVTMGKLYSIQNNVTHENETGVAMARMYLNATSKVEEIEGQYYVTLTFTGAEYMQNHEIYVNGNKVSVSKSTSGDETYIRFAVGSLNDSIKVKTYVAPMGRNVEFGVELLTDTLTFIKEYSVTLPNTGAATSSVAVAGLGLILSSAGVVLTKKRK